MKLETLRVAARDQLNLVLSFFPRVDSRASAVLAVNTGMLALLSANTPSWKALSWLSSISLIPVALIGISLYNLYRTVFPTFHGGHASLIYFREVAKRTENKFIDEFTQQSEEEYVKDLLGQVWRNSEILKEKFDHLKYAYVFLSLAIVPWVATLILFTAWHNQNLSLK